MQAEWFLCPISFRLCIEEVDFPLQKHVMLFHNILLTLKGGEDSC